MNRRLCAILAADIVGYSRLMREFEAQTLSQLRDLRAEVLNPVLADHSGRILKSMGDGWLVEFASAVDAVSAAMRVQDRLAERGHLCLRMGLHIGEVTQDDDDVYGDGINIAARLEAEAPEGGLLISDAVHANLDGTLQPSFTRSGARRLKNIDREIVTWMRAPADPPPMPRAGRSDEAFPVLLIAPVASSDPRAEVQELANSLTADLHTYFNSAPWLRATVTATAPGGTYVLRPVLRSRGDRLRLEARLTGPDNGAIWTHKSETMLEDSFDWQDKTVEAVASEGIDLVLEAEYMRLNAIPQDQLTAENHHLLGIMAWRTFGLAAFVDAVGHQERAIALNPELVDAYADAITVSIAGRTMVGGDPRLAEQYARVPEWVEAARPLIAGQPYLIYAVALADFIRNGKLAALNRSVEQVIRLSPFDPRLLSSCGWAYLWSGQTQTALDCFEKSLRFGLRGPFTVSASGGAAIACVQLGRDVAALRHCERGLKLSDEYPTLYSVRAAALALNGQLDAARAIMAQYRRLLPDRTLSSWRKTNGYNGAPGAERYFEGLRLAGLPES